MRYRLWVDHDECVSSGACVLEAPEAFEYQEGPEALAIVLPGADTLDDDRKLEVAGVCPMGAIKVLDDNDRQVN